jgi:hypothetical protein
VPRQSAVGLAVADTTWRVWLTVQRYVETVSLSSTMGKAFKIRRLTLNLKKDKSIDVD